MYMALSIKHTTYALKPNYPSRGCPETGSSIWPNEDSLTLGSVKKGITSTPSYSGTCDFRSLHLTNPSILRLSTTDTALRLSI